MKHVKKLIVLMMALFFILAGCGTSTNNEKANSSNNGQGNSGQAEQPEQETPEDVGNSSNSPTQVKPFVQSKSKPQKEKLSSIYILTLHQKRWKTLSLTRRTVIMTA